MKTSLAGIFVALGMVLATAIPSEAHTFGAQGAGFFQGLGHPFGGADHVLAMAAAGLWAGLLGGAARWLLPLTFVAMMAAGGALGAAGFLLPGSEAGIALSVLALGGAVALRTRWPAGAGAAIVGLFAVFHGFVHGAEVPQAASGIMYGLGFVLGTSLLCAACAAAASGLESRGKRPIGFVRFGGGAIALYGLLLLIGA